MWPPHQEPNAELAKNGRQNQLRENNQDVRSANEITSETTKEDHHHV